VTPPLIHCLEEGESRVQFKLDTDDTHSAKCKRSESYDFKTKMAEYDYALCELEGKWQDYPAWRGPFELVAGEPILKVNDGVRLMGFGCTQFGDFLIGGEKLRYANVNVSSIHAKGTIEVVSKSGFCHGDSGGAVYKITKDKYGSSRRIVGIASKIALLPDEKGELFRSISVDVTHTDFLDMARSWLLENTKRQICGLSKSFEGCRQPDIELGIQKHEPYH